MSTTHLIIEDEINCKFLGLDPDTRRKLVKVLEYEIPGARYTPAVKLGRWSGKASYFSISGSTYINLLDKLLPIIDSAGYDVEIEDRREPTEPFEFEKVDSNSYSHVLWPEGHPLAGQPVVIKDHQVEMVNAYLENLTGINVIPTAGGKTIITAILSNKIEPYGRSIIIVPTRDLVTQTEEDYINFGLDVGVFYGGRKEYNKTHTICTWQSLESLSKKSKKFDLEVDIDKFFENVVCVICDETHKVTGQVLRNLLGGPLAYAPIRWGLTGTLPEAEHDKTAILSCIGPMIGKITAKDLQDKGILANLHIHVMQLKDLGDSVFANYQQELAWLTTSKPRLTFLADEFIKIAETGNTLILVDRIQTGEMLQLLMPGSIFISGKMKSSDRKDEYKDVQEVDGKIIIATFGVASTGISINRIFNLVLFEPGKSFIKVIQSIGRGLRVAQDKTHVNVYDICSTSKYSKKHLSKRKIFYKDAEYPFSVKIVDY